jgi:hypothetical protein
MSRADAYRTALKTQDDWEPYLLRESGLPGPRANLELVQAVADEGDEEIFRRWLTFTTDHAPANTPAEFLPLCGVVGLGRLLAEGQTELRVVLRAHAADPRWRVREGVALALQRLGERDMPALLGEMAAWSGGSLLEQRAAVAALCEPRLLANPAHARATVEVLDRITGALPEVTDRRSPDFKALRQTLGYGWSVAVAALGAEGKPRLERWFAHPDPDIRWIMKENLRKHRLRRLDAAWVDRWMDQLPSPPGRG